MKLDVSNALSHPGQEYLFSGLQAIADQEISGDTVRIDDCAVEGVFLSDEDGNISVRGKLKTIAHAHCANCLEDAQAEVENEFDEVFHRNGDQEDNEIFAYEGHEILLDKLVMSYAVMALPIRFLCREDCPGFEYRDPEAESWLFRRGKSLRLASTAAAPTGSSHCRESASARSAVR